MYSVKCKPRDERLIFVNRLEPPKQKKVLDALVFIEKHKHGIRRRPIRSDADVRAFMISLLRQNVSVDGDTNE